MLPNGTTLLLRNVTCNLAADVSEAASAASWQLLVDSEPALQALHGYARRRLPAAQVSLAQEYLFLRSYCSDLEDLQSIVRDLERTRLQLEVRPAVLGFNWQCICVECPCHPPPACSMLLCCQCRHVLSTS